MEVQAASGDFHQGILEKPGGQKSKELTKYLSPFLEVLYRIFWALGYVRFLESVWSLSCRPFEKVAG